MKNKTSQKGSALIYILIAIALLAALTATFMDSSSQQTTSQNTFNTVTDLNTQVNFIRSAIQECVLSYPSGVTDITDAENPPYPLNPTSTYFTGLPAADQSPNDQATYVKCPGNPQADAKHHGAIFGGNSGKFLPPPPKLFNNWTYYNGKDGVFFYTSTDKTDAYLSTALSKLDDQYSECEADIIDNSTGSGNLSIISASSGGTAACPAKSLCFRVWMIANSTADYSKDIIVAPATQSDEVTAGCPGS